jgi:hypothetical protein
MEVMAGFEDAGGQDRRAGMLNLAETTGGTVTPGGQRVGERLRRARGELGAVYVLAYPRPAGRPGTTRRIEVRVPAQPRLRVRHRRTLADLGGEAALEQRLLGTLHFGRSGGDNPLALRVEAGAPTAAEEGGFVVPVRVRVGLGRLGMEPGERDHRGHLTMAIAALDERGRVSPVQRGEQAISIPHERLLEALSGDAAYTFSVRVRSGRQRLAVAVRDDVTRTIAVGEVELLAGPGEG